MAITFQSSALQAMYNGTNSGAPSASSELNTFRTGGDVDLDEAIAALDSRIAAFESILIGSNPAGKTSSNFPYDRAGLKREFLDEVAAMLARRSVSNNTINSTYTTSLGNVDLSVVSTFKGGAQVALASTGTTGNGVFDNLSTANSTNENDPRLNMLTDAGKRIFKSYAYLIDAVFQEGDKLRNNPSQSVQIVSALQPVTIDGVTYSQSAQVSLYNQSTGDTVPVTYLLESTGENSHVIKDAQGNAVLTTVPNSTDRRLHLDPRLMNPGTGSTFARTVDGVAVSVTFGANGVVTAESGNQNTAALVEPMSPLSLNVPGREDEFPDVALTITHRFTATNNITYLVGKTNEGAAYIISTAPANRTAVGTVGNLSGLEYLLFYNEARIKILRAQLGYKEAVVREIQDDLAKANDALADLEKQAGAITATDKDGQPTFQFSSETLAISLFNATNSVAGDPIFTRPSADNLHNATEWQTNRTNLKNYIDRRSSEAQEATLDYQNVLNRFNNALEVMAKLQEKLDGLLKGQLRNLA